MHISLPNRNHDEVNIRTATYMQSLNVHNDHLPMSIINQLVILLSIFLLLYLKLYVYIATQRTYYARCYQNLLREFHAMYLFVCIRSFLLPFYGSDKSEKRHVPTAFFIA